MTNQCSSYILCDPYHTNFDEQYWLTTMTTFNWMTMATLVRRQTASAVFTLYKWGIKKVRAKISNREPECATPNEHYFGRELVDLGKDTEREQQQAEEQQAEEPENGIEMISTGDTVGMDIDDYVTVQAETLYDSVNFQLYRNQCPICYEEPASEQVSVVVLPCSHIICGDCLFRSVEHAMNYTGLLNCPLCMLPYEA